MSQLTPRKWLQRGYVYKNINNISNICCKATWILTKMHYRITIIREKEITLDCVFWCVELREGGRDGYKVTSIIVREAKRTMTGLISSLHIPTIIRKWIYDDDVEMENSCSNTQWPSQGPSPRDKSIWENCMQWHVKK